MKRFAASPVQPLVVATVLALALALAATLAYILPALAEEADTGQTSETEEVEGAEGAEEPEEAEEAEGEEEVTVALAGAKVKLAKSSYTYTGRAIKPAVTVTLDGVRLVAGTDYTVSYKRNKNAGKAYVVVTGAGSYTGSVKQSFKIAPKSLKKLKVKLSKKRYVYNGKAKKPKVTVRGSGTKIAAKNYRVTYAKGRKKCGIHKVTVKGRGNYTGTVKRKFIVRPAKAATPKLSSDAAKQVKATWHKSGGGVTGYQMAWRAKGAKKWKTKRTVSTGRTLNGLTIGTVYQVKVRAYKRAGGKRRYGAWSKVAAITCKGDKIVYLTFDDGPSANMGKVLDVLDEYDVKATFFVTGNNASYRYLIKRAYKEGHAIGLHSYTHSYSQIYASESAFYKDLSKISDLVKSLTGKRSYLLRFPGGSSNTVSRHYSRGIMSRLTKSVQAKGYTYFDWNVDSGDASGNNVATSKLVANATTTSYKKVNILMHSTDAKDTTVEALPKIIKYYKSKGYVFQALSTSSYAPHHGVNN